MVRIRLFCSEKVIARLEIIKGKLFRSDDLFRQLFPAAGEKGKCPSTRGLPLEKGTYSVSPLAESIAFSDV